MTKGLLAILLLVVSNAFAQNTLLQQRWIAVNSGHLKNDFIRPLNGLIVEFNSKTVNFGSIFSDSTATEALVVDKKRINVAGKSFGTISSLTSHSLVIDFDRRMRVHFVPFTTYQPKIASLTLENSSWMLTTVDSSDFIPWRITFLSGQWDNETGGRIAIRQSKWGNYKNQEDENWSSRQLYGELFLNITFGQLEQCVFQVTDYSTDAIELKSLIWPGLGNEQFSFKRFSFKRIKDTTPEHRDSVTNKLTARTWSSKEVLNYSSSLTGIVGTEEIANFRMTDTTLVSRKDLLSNWIAFKSDRDFSFQMIVNDKSFYKTTWHLSGDAKYVVLDKGYSPYNYIEITSLSDEELIIGKADEFSIEEANRFFDYYYQLKMR